MTDSPKYYVEYFSRIPIKKSDIDKIGEENFSFFSTILFAANEMFVYQKIMTTYIKRPDNRNNEILTLHFIHQLTILRTLSAKIVEFIKLYEDQRKIWGRRKRETELLFMKEDTESLKLLKESEFFNFTKKMRNKIINHYVVSEVSGNLPHTSDGSDFSIQLHEEQGNSFFPIGEEVVFIGFVNRFLTDEDKIYTSEQKADFINDWISWALKSLKWVNDVVQSFSKFIIFEKLDLERIRKRYFILNLTW